MAPYEFDVDRRSALRSHAHDHLRASPTRHSLRLLRTFT